MSNIKDLYVIDIKIIDDEIELLEKWKKDNRQSSEAWVCDNMIDGLENLKNQLKPLEPIVSERQPTLPTDEEIAEEIIRYKNAHKTSISVGSLRIDKVADDFAKWMRDKIKSSATIPMHECKYCGIMTDQPDENCYKAPQQLNK